jgi:hypothetical protein
VSVSTVLARKIFVGKNLAAINQRTDLSDVKLNHVRGGGCVSIRNMAQSSDAGSTGKHTTKTGLLSHEMTSTVQ